jgi:hypothetical protein
VGSITRIANGRVSKVRRHLAPRVLKIASLV